jgi:hypothetical protein
MHKTNSSYFSDLDESRLRLLFSLCPDWLSLHGKRRMAMGGTSCTFYQAIAPFQAYEVRSQVLCWDKKWLYISSDFLKFGSSRQLANVGSLENELRETSRSRSRIIASAITKYCFKLNCFTVAPDIALKEKMLLATESSNALERRNAEGMRFARSVTTLGELRDRLDIVIVG